MELNATRKSKGDVMESLQGGAPVFSEKTLVGRRSWPAPHSGMWMWGDLGRGPSSAGIELGVFGNKPKSLKQGQ